MSLIINPGSGDVEYSGEGWTNTHENARINAYDFYKRIIADGITDITVTDKKEDRGGRWAFGFKHNITGVEVELEIDGIDNYDAFMKTHIFGTRTYWNGSSSCLVELEHWKADGFEPVRTFRKVE